MRYILNQKDKNHSLGITAKIGKLIRKSARVSQLNFGLEFLIKLPLR